MPPSSVPPSGGAGSLSVNLSNGNCGRSGRNSAALTPNAWPRPSHPDRRRRSENFELTDDRHRRQRRIGLQIDDLEVGRYLTIPEIVPVRSPSSASPPRLSSVSGT